MLCREGECSGGWSDLRAEALVITGALYSGIGLHVIIHNYTSLIFLFGGEMFV